MNALQALRGDDIQTRGCLISTAEALNAYLRGRKEVVSLRWAIIDGEITPIDVEKFVDDLLQSFCAGTKFSDEITLAAIAVAVETLPMQFAQTFLESLASLKIEEMSLAWRAARLSLRRRQHVLSGVTNRKKTISSQPLTGALTAMDVNRFIIDAQLSQQEYTLKEAS